MEAAINSLPDEILEIIFSYCTHSDLVQSIENVCCRWREVAQSTRVWRCVTYCADYDAESEQVVDMLEISPNLHNITLRNKYDNRVLQAITDNCSELRKLEILYQGIDMSFIKNLQENCPKVEYLNIPHPMLTQLDKCVEFGKFTNLKALHLTSDPPKNISILKSVADYSMKLGHLEFWTSKFEINDLDYFLNKRKDTLHTLGVCCCNDSGECVLPSLSPCELKSLALFRYSQCRRHYEKIEHFGRLKTVKALSITQFSFEDLKQIFENENMAQLVELRLEHSRHFYNDLAEVIARNCPMLQKVSLKYLRDMTHRTCVTDKRILHLKDVKCLKCLNIRRCEVDLGNIIKLGALQHLSLELQNIAEFPWDQIPHHMENLQRLRFCLCTDVNLFAIEELKMQLPRLKVEVLPCFL